MSDPYRICDFVPLTNRNPHYSRFAIGDWTYGLPLLADYGEGVGLQIGKFCSIADGVMFMLGGEHRPKMVTTYPFNAFFPFADSQETHRKIKGDIIVGNDVWLGRDCMVLSGVNIGNGAIIGARAVVTKNVQAYSIVVGSPARHIRFRFDEALIAELEKIAWWDWPMPEIEAALPLLLSENIQGFIDTYKKGND